MATDVPAYTEETWVEGAAPGIAAAQLQRMDDQIKALTVEFNLHNGGRQQDDHGEASSGLRGFMSATHKAKLDTFNYEASNPVSIAAVASDGTDNDISRGDHIHRIFDARTVAVTAKRNFTNAQSALGSTFADKASISFSRPTGWSSTLVLAHGITHYDAASVGVRGRCRIRIDSNSGDDHLGALALVDGEIICTASHLFQTTESIVNIAIQDKHDGTSGSNGLYAWVEAVLIRAN